MNIIGRILREEIDRFINEEEKESKKEPFKKHDDQNVPDSVAKSISNKIDWNTTNLRALANKTGSPVPAKKASEKKATRQSYLRKMINGERPMTKPVANFLNTQIATGQVATK